MIHAPSAAATARIRARHAPAISGHLVVTPAVLGVGAFARLVRDGVVRELSTGSAAPHVLAALPLVRAASLAHFVPARGALTGLAALWVHGWRSRHPLCTPITIAAPTGVRLSEPAGALVRWRAVTHDGSLAHSRSLAGVAVADPAAALAMALSHDALADAIPAAWWALRTDSALATQVDKLLPKRGPSARRAASAWRAVTTAATDAQEPS